MRVIEVAVAGVFTAGSGCADSGGGNTTDPTTGPTSSTAGSASDGNMSTTESADTTAGPGGSTSGDESGSSSGSTGGGPLCGNEMIDGDEQCDDANDVQSDGCNNNCVISGSLIWSHSHASGLAAADQFGGVAVDDDGDGFVVGHEQGAADSDILIRRYGAPGELIWSRSVNVSGADTGHAVARDASGNIYVVGSSSAGAGNIWVARYDADGNQGPTASHGGGAAGSDGGRGVVVGPMGPVVVGFEAVAMQSHNVFVRQYDSALAEVWTSYFNSGAGSPDQGLAVAIDSAGCPIVVGFETVGSENGWVRKYDPGGGEVWTRSYDGVDMLADRAHGVAVEDDDEIIVVGWETRALAPTLHGWMRKYNALGDELWTVTDDGDSGEGAQHFAVSVAADGTIVTAGVQFVLAFQQLVVVKYDPAGDELWREPVEGTPMTSNPALGVATTANAAVYAVGGLNLGVDARDAFIGRFAR